VWLRRAVSPTRSPRVPPVTMLGPEETRHRGDGVPNIVKDGTPQKALSSAYRSQRLNMLVNGPGARHPVERTGVDNRSQSQDARHRHAL
jgi:hypothetical protein